MIVLPQLGTFGPETDLIPLAQTSDGAFVAGRDGVGAVASTGDGKVEFVGLPQGTLALVRSALGYPAWYSVLPVERRRPVRAVLMDLDGTSVHSEHFWIWMIELTTASLRGEPGFTLEAADLPFVAGHSVSEHLQYCLEKYAPGQTLEEARRVYFEHTHREMREILEGRGRADAFTPAPGLKDFLFRLKDRGVRIGLVTSGLHEKAYPEIVAAFRQLGMGDPAEFYDTIITGGFPLRRGHLGTLGELAPKPHPWLYAEAYRLGLGLPIEDRAHAVGIEDSGAGVCAVRLAGLPVIGLAGGNIRESGTLALCDTYCDSLEDVARALFD